MSEIIAEAIIPADVLGSYVDAMQAVVRETKIHFNDDGLTASAVEAGNVVMYDPATLDKSAFEHYDAPGSATIGVELEKFDDRLGLADPDDLVNIAIDMETRDMVLEYGGVTHTVGLINTDTIREEPDTNEMDLPNQFTVEGRTLTDAIKHCDMLGSHDIHMTIEGDVDGESVHIVSEGDTDDVDIEFGAEEVVEADVREDVASMFSVSYFEETTKPIPAGAEVTVQFGEEFPAMLYWEGHDGNLTVSNMIAPRIQSQ